MGHVDEGRLDAARGERALRRLVDRLPFFPDRPVEAWTAPSGRAAAAWVSHGPEQTGGVRYAAPGDHGRLAPDGAIVVLGRGSVSINTGGEKVYAEEVEQILRRHPAVADAVVVGTPDERFGEQVTAVVQARDGQRVAPEELTAFASQSLARYKLPKTVVLVDEMVRSPSGKPDYRWARARALEARGLPAG